MALDQERLNGLMAHVSIVHHVQGRLRLRLHSGVLAWLAQTPDGSPESWLARLPGVSGLRLNKAAASLLIEYDARLIPPNWWERLLRGDNASALLAEIGFASPDFFPTTKGV
jgi:hypothetical protein